MFKGRVEVRQKLIFSILILIPLIGCAASTQYFREELREWDPETGAMVTEHILHGKNLTMAPPVGSRAISDHRMWMEQTDENWIIEMGSKSDIDGGDASKVIKAATPIITGIPLP